MKHWTEAECLVTAISHVINQRKELTKRIVAEKAGMSPAYLTLLLKQDRGKALQTFERVANACELTICEAIEIGRAILSKSGIEDIPSRTKEALEETDRIDGLVEVLDELKEYVAQIESEKLRAEGVVVERHTLEQFPLLEEYIQILNHACKAGDRGFAKDAIRRLLEVVLNEEYGDRYMDAG